MSFSIRADDGAPWYWSLSTAPQSHRLWLGSAVANEAWTIRIQGLSIPAYLDDGPFENKQKRGVFLAYYWEDRLRDDPDGPNGNFDDPYDIY